MELDCALQLGAQLHFLDDIQLRHLTPSTPQFKFSQSSLKHERQKWKPLLRQDHAQAIELARVLFDQVIPPGRNAR